jgi:hypothetical protein
MATNAGHVANGCTLRNSPSCVINLRGIPKGSTIKKAFLYWAFTSTTGTATPAQQTIIFKDVQLFGALIGSGPDACWCGVPSVALNATNVVYREDVTSLVTGNGGYEVTLAPFSTPLTNGANPWEQTKCPSSKQGLAEGASLVVVYSNSTETGTTLVYDSGLAGTMFFSSLSYGLGGVPTPSAGPSIFTELGGDGQTGFGFTGSATGKKTSLNGTLIVGPSGVNQDSDWDGTDGTPLNQLWDTHSHDVTSVVATGTNTVSIAAGFDCLITVANVLTVR